MKKLLDVALIVIVALVVGAVVAGALYVHSQRECHDCTVTP